MQAFYYCSISISHAIYGCPHANSEEFALIKLSVSLYAILLLLRYIDLSCDILVVLMQILSSGIQQSTEQWKL